MTSDHHSIALVTGGNRGIGYAVAAGLGRLGATVVLGARDLDHGRRAAADLRADGVDAHATRLDVTAAHDPAAAADWIDTRFGRLDILVNNAGIAGERAAQRPGSVEIDTVRAVFATNVLGAIAVLEAMLPLLRRSARARVVNVGSGLGSLTRMSDPEDYFAALPANLGYAPSKSALNQVTVQYAKHLAPEHILVNTADPGPCATDFTADVPGLTRTAADGARVILRLACLDAGGPTGGCFADQDRVPW